MTAQLDPTPPDPARVAIARCLRLAYRRGLELEQVRQKEAQDDIENRTAENRVKPNRTKPKTGE